MLQVKKKVAVVGAGLSGLAAAIHLALAGCEVRVFEQQTEVGGRASRLRQGGFAFDLGPSLLMMPEILEGLFEAAGARMADHLKLHRLSEGSRYHLADGRSFPLGAEAAQRGEALQKVDPVAAQRLEAFLADLGGLQAAGMAGFIRPARMRLGGLMRPKQVGYFLRGMVVGSYSKLLRRRLGPGPLAEALVFLALYLGMDPRDTPAVFAVLLEAELVGGLHYPEGGMHAIPRALQALAEGLGVRFELGCPVRGLRRSGRLVEGLELSDGSFQSADGVLLALDWATAKQKLLGESLPRRLASGCSAYVLHLGVQGALPALGHHSVFLPPSMDPFLDDLKAGRLAEAPAWYVCKPSATDPSLAPPGHEQLYALIPVPHEGAGLNWTEALPQLRAQALQGLKAFGLEDEGRIVAEAAMGPPQMREAWGLHQGAAFGLAHGWGQLGPFRPGHGHRVWRNLAFAGASNHPGNGIPLVLLSGRQAAEHLLASLGLPVKG